MTSKTDLRRCIIKMNVQGNLFAFGVNDGTSDGASQLVRIGSQRASLA